MLGLDIKEIITVGMVLFAVIDIIGSIPIIIGLRDELMSIHLLLQVLLYYSF